MKSKYIILSIIFLILPTCGCIDNLKTIHLSENTSNIISLIQSFIPEQTPISVPSYRSTDKKIYSDEQKLIGIWRFKTNRVNMEFVFNTDGSGTLIHSDYGKSHFKYRISDNKLVFYDTDGLGILFLKDTSIDIYGISRDNCCKYKFINDKEIVILDMTFEKS